jgi:hypothetical protein
MDGTDRQRRAVQADMWRRHAIAMRRRYAELHPDAAGLDVFETHAPEQLAFWQARLTNAEYVYFIRSRPHGPVNIGLSNKPQRRLPQLQTGDPDALLLADLAVEQRLYRRFEPARSAVSVRKEYLPIILAFAAGLADRMLHAYDGSGQPPELARGDVRSPAEIQRIRRDIERLWRAGHPLPQIARYTWLDEAEVADHLDVMRASPIWDVQTPGGYYAWGDRVLPSGPRRRRKRRPPPPRAERSASDEPP